MSEGELNTITRPSLDWKLGATYPATGRARLQTHFNFLLKLRIGYCDARSFREAPFSM